MMRTPHKILPLWGREFWVGLPPAVQGRAGGTTDSKLAEGGGGVRTVLASACWRDSANRFAKLLPPLLFAPLHREGAVPLPLQGRI
jgi:hypothetical protein